MNDLIAFVRRCLDDDERVTRADDTDKNRCVSGTCYFATGISDGGDAGAAKRWDPARVLAEVDAKRRILDEYVRWNEDDDLNWDNARDAATMASALLVAIKALAQPYAGRDGWHEEWRDAPQP
jgi:hypothetical protein